MQRDGAIVVARVIVAEGALLNLFFPLQQKVVDPFTKKEWFHIKAPAPFNVRDMGWTPANRTEGQRTVAENLKGRVFEVSLADLQSDESLFYQNIKLKCQEVQGQDALTSFHGLDFTTDKKRSLVRKWQTLIEAHLDVKTTDGYFLRLFCIGFTRRMQNQLAKTSYAQSSQVKRIRRKMFTVMQREAASSDLKTLVSKFISNSIGERVARECQGIYPLQNVFIRKVKVLKSPKFDAYKFADLHSADAQAPLVGATAVNIGEDTGAPAERPVGDEQK
jgi:small subunit ribosomal protein S3Ae